MRSMRLLSLMLSVLVGACGGTPAANDARTAQTCLAPSAPSHAVRVSLEAARAEQRASLCPGHVLGAHDVLWVRVALDVEAHVRMVFVAADGESGEVLSQAAVEVTREAVFRAPEGLLARAAGEAQLVIVASRGQLGTVDPALASMFDVIRETGILVERDGTLRPPRSVREPPQELRLGTENLHADFDEHGIALLTIKLKTAP